MVATLIFRHPILLQTGTAIYTGDNDFVRDNCTYFHGNVYNFELMDSDLENNAYYRAFITPEKYANFGSDEFLYLFSIAHVTNISE